VAATKGRSGSAMTVRRRHGTGMGKSDATAERRWREGRTDTGARREREGEGEARAQERQSDEEPVSHRLHRCGSGVNHSLALCCAAVSFPPPLSRPSRLRFPYEFTRRLRFRYESTRRLRRTATATSSQLITPSPYILYCRFSSPSHTAFITLSATAFFHYNNIINISAPVTRIHLSLHHETNRFVLSSRRALIDYDTLCSINSPRQQRR
jgi:hypothetical protein